MTFLELCTTIPGMMVCFCVLLFVGASIEQIIKSIDFDFSRPRVKAAPQIERPAPKPTPAPRKELGIKEVEGLAYASAHPVMRQHRLH